MQKYNITILVLTLSIILTIKGLANAGGGGGSYSLKMLDFAEVANVSDAYKPDRSTWPKTLIYTFNSSADFGSAIGNAALPPNNTAGYFCPKRTVHTADFFWTLCPANQDLSSTSLHCSIMQMYVLKEAQKCIDFRENYIQSKTSKTLKKTGFWSSRCRCFSVITRLLELLNNANNWKYCGDSATTILSSNFQVVYSSVSSISTNEPWKSTFDAVKQYIDDEISKNTTESSFILKYKTEWPYYVDFLEPKNWLCYDDLAIGSSEDYYGGDVNPYSTPDIQYINELFWAIPPNYAYTSNNNNVPTKTPSQANIGSSNRINIDFGLVIATFMIWIVRKYNSISL